MMHSINSQVLDGQIIGPCDWYFPTFIGFFSLSNHCIVITVDVEKTRFDSFGLRVDLEGRTTEIELDKVA